MVRAPSRLIGLRLAPRKLDFKGGRIREGFLEQPANPASPNWTRHRVTTTFSLNNLDAADFDRDGDIDLVTAEHKGAELRLLLYRNDGRGNFTERVLDRGKESHLGTQAAGLDGDGDLDLVSIGWDRHPFLHLWRNDAIPSRR